MSSSLLGGQSVATIRALAVSGTQVCAAYDDGVTRCTPLSDSLRRDVATERAMTSRNLPFTALAAGREHVCGLTASGTVWCWGSNRLGQLGTASATWQGQPRQVRSAEHFTALVAGTSHTCALAATGQVWCWGDQWDGAVGAYEAGASVFEPLPIGGARHFRSVAAGGARTCGLMPSDSIVCWGLTPPGQGAGRGARLRRFTPGPSMPAPLVTGLVVSDGPSCLLRVAELICGGSLRADTLPPASTARLTIVGTAAAAAGPVACAVVRAPSAQLECVTFSYARNSATTMTPITPTRSSLSVEGDPALVAVGTTSACVAGGLSPVRCARVDANGRLTGSWFTPLAIPR